MDSVVFDTRKQADGKAKAEYRRVNKNYKSLKQYKKEQARRDKAVELWEKGFSAEQIASELGFSKRTITRDLDDARQSSERKLKRLTRSLAEEERARIVKHLDSLSAEEQVNWIMQYSTEAKKARRCRRECHKLLVTVDADAAAKGCCALKFKPASPRLVPPCMLTFRLVLEGKNQVVGQISID